MAHAMTQSGFDRVKELAEGQWDSIIGSLYPSIAKAISRPGLARCACPVHHSTKGPRADGFRVFDDFIKTGGGVCNTCGTFPTGIDLICFLEGQENNPKHALRILEEYFGLGRGEKVQRTAPQPRPKEPIYDERSDPEAIKKRLWLLNKIWDDSVPLSELPEDHHAIRYLTETRGADDFDLLAAQENMRFNERLFYEKVEDEENTPVYFPGLVSVMQTVDGEMAGLHRIYLDPKKPQKASVEKNKKILGRLEARLNGAVRINGRAPFTEHANVCEGIETAVAIAYSTGHSIFAAGYTTLMSKWMPPEGTRYVTVWADRDANEAGIRHALELKERLQDMGLKCRILVPDFLATEKEDWNDVLLECGFEEIAEAYSGLSEQTEVY